MRKCEVEGCDKKHLSRGYCQLHYHRSRRKGIIIPLEKVLRTCEAEECDEKHYARGYCRNHHSRFIKYGDPYFIKQYLAICTIDGCERKTLAKGLCSKHYNRSLKYGDPSFAVRKRVDHGMGSTKIYGVWTAMKQRCYNENNKAYPRYGGRGITMCARWKNFFMAFYEDVGDRPFLKAQLDRIDNDGNYEVINCRWVTQTINLRNSSCTKLTRQKANEIETQYKAGKITITELSKLHGVTYSAIWRIIKQKAWIV